MDVLNASRIGIAAQCVGIAQAAYDAALDYARQRKAFGQRLSEFQGLQWMLVDMGTEIEAARLMILKAARSAEREGGQGFPDITAAARAKILASETAIRVTNDALQVFGAAGYSRNRPLERMVRDARMFTIGGGTAQILRTVVASQILGRKLPQTRDGYQKMAEAKGETKGEAKGKGKNRKKG
jgi:alkylation response protein AidB-like acyl-CoA dehydrogenase